MVDFGVALLLGAVIVILSLIIGAQWTTNRNAERIRLKFTGPSTSKPEVAFPFEPLTELAEQTAKKFEAYPLEYIPQVFISPGHYFFSEKVPAFYHYASNAIYFKDTYVNYAKPEQLLFHMKAQLLHAWLHQHRDKMVGDLKIDDDTYKVCYAVAARLFGFVVTKRALPDIGMSPVPQDFWDGLEPPEPAS